MSRRPAEDRWAVVSFHKQGLTTAAICRTTGFDRQFVTRCISKYNDSGSIDDAPRAGRPRKLSEGVERTVEKKMRGKRRRSSRVIARELKRQKVADVSRMTAQTARIQTASNLAPVSSSQARSIAVRSDQHQEGLEQCGI